MLTKAKSNTDLTGLNVDYLGIEHIHVNKDPKIYMGRRTYSWINSCMSFTSHVKMGFTEKEQIVSKPEVEVAQNKTLSQKKLNKQKLIEWE